MLQSQDLRVGQEREPCIENFVWNYLPYILKPHGSC